MLVRKLFTLIIIAGFTASTMAAESRSFAVREGTTIEFLDGSFNLKLLKIRGYSIDVRTSEGRLDLKVNQSIMPHGSGCSIIFEEVASETRIARFNSDCP